MRFSFAVVLAAFAASASAELLPRQAGLPPCALQCTLKAPFGNCSPTDNACLCTNQNFLDFTAQCIAQTCTGADLTNAINLSKQMCLAAGVTLTSTPPGFPSGTATDAPASTGSAASSAGSSAGGSAGGSASGSAPAPASTTNAASINGVSAMAGLAALGLAAFGL